MGEYRGQLVELEISNVAHGGIMVARHEGRVVFVSDAIPGERVRAVITDDAKKSFWRADTVEVLQASDFRQPHVWDAAALERAPEERAGGAEFGHIRLDHQRELKRRVIVDSLQRMGGLTVDAAESALAEVEAVPGKPDGTGWRTRVRLHAEDGVIGPYAARSHRVIPVTSLPLATDAIAAAAPLGGSFLGPLDLVGTSTGEVFVLDAEGRRLGDDRRGRASEEPLTITERVGDREFRLEARGFWQVHAHAAQSLTTAVQDAVDPAIFDPAAANLDLYGGVGLLAAAVGDRFGAGLRIESVESDRAATAFAEQNLVDWAGATAVTARVDRYLARARQSGVQLTGATVVLDPPRAGAGREVVEALAALAPAQLVYVACDPVALARDLGGFAALGYRLDALRAFDLFPHTHHVEAVARLVRG